MDRSDAWISTFSGHRFWPTDPRADEVYIEDIAHALSQICRFTGHCIHFYSVADHSVRASHIVPPEHAKWGLLHDASEAYIADVSRPVKPHLENYVNIEREVMRAVAERFDLPWPMPPCIHEADNVLVCTERRDLMLPGHAWGEWSANVPLLDERISPVNPKQAEHDFLRRYEELFQ